MLCFLFKLLTFIGFVRVLLWIFGYVKKLFLLKEINFAERYGRSSWAVVTGGSEGIGFGIAKRLAKEGFNIVLIARKEDKLRQAKEELLKINPLADVLTISKDFAESHKAEFFEDIERRLSTLDISILVNNVGLLHIKNVMDMTAAEIRDEIVVNTCSQIGMSKILLPRFQKRSKRCAQIDLSSSATVNPMPLFGVYGATKAVNQYMSHGLASYVKNTDFLTVNPGIVSTPMTNHKTVNSGADPALKVASVDDAVKGIFEALGNVSWTAGALKHTMIYEVLYSVVPLIPLDIRSLIFSKQKSTTSVEFWKSG